MHSFARGFEARRVGKGGHWAFVDATCTTRRAHASGLTAWARRNARRAYTAASRPPLPTLRDFHIRTVIGGALVLMLSIGGCEHALSQMAVPQPPADMAVPPTHSDSRKENPAPAPSGLPDAAVSTADPNVSETPVASEARLDEVKAYLWSVYRRSGAKVDSHGEFTWKDIAAAITSGLTVEDYVISGIDPDFRELLFAAGHAMDAAGVEWTILSAFRDDYRQNLASGLKARVNNSFHGGSEATGGYGHGCAADLASVDRHSDDKVWSWLDRKGREFALYRPLRAVDPAHVLPMAGWHELATTLRNKRLGIAAEPDSAPLGALVTLGQYLCVRPLPPEKPAPGAEGAQASRHPVSQGSANHGAKHDANSPGNGPAQKPNGAREAQTKPSARTAASKVMKQ